MSLRKNKRLTKIVFIIALFILGWIIFEVIVKGFDVVNQEYGINPKTFFTIFIIAEIFFDLGILLMIMGSGVLKVRFRHIFKLNFQDLVFENKLVYTGFTLNRIAALIPPIYLLWAGWGRLPLAVFLLILLELVIVLLIATIPFELERIMKFFRSKH